MKFLMSLFVSLLLAQNPARADAPAVHGMLVFGGQAGTYASHLPMFHPPHDRQLVLKISLEEVPGSNTLKAYELARSQGKTLFTIEPQTMDLEAIATGSKAEFLA